MEPPGIASPARRSYWPLALLGILASSALVVRWLAKPKLVASVKPNTQEPASPTKRISENQPTINAGCKSTKDRNQANTPVPDTSTSVEADNQERPHHREIACKTEQNWWDKTKPFVEIAGVILLAIYAGYTIKIYRANKNLPMQRRTPLSKASMRFGLMSELG